MTTESLENELLKVKEEILKMGRLLEEQVYQAIKSLVNKNPSLAHEVIEKDDMIDLMELQIERKILSLVALKQPMAKDLRMIATAFRIIIDIERMADHAEDIARIAIDIHKQSYFKPLIDIPKMGNIARKMVEVALSAFIAEDVSISMEILDMEREMDRLYAQVSKDLQDFMIRDAENIPQATAFFLVAGHLERIGDHATNIAELVFYVKEAKRVNLNQIAREGLKKA